MRALRWRKLWLLTAFLATVLILASQRILYLGGDRIRMHQSHDRIQHSDDRIHNDRDNLPDHDHPLDLEAPPLDFLSDLTIALREFIDRQPDVDATSTFNRLLSDRIGPRRSLPDTRPAECRRSIPLGPRSQTATVSVIIVFHNEPRSLLARTLISLLERTPWQHLKEILLVDDASDDEDLLSQLERVMEASSSALSRLRPSAPLIKMHRMERRQGLIASRNVGAALASGRFLLFLDSHCEVNLGWLEPMLERVVGSRGDGDRDEGGPDDGGRDDRNGDDGGNDGGDDEEQVAVSPMLDRIDAQTFEYRASASDLRGGFDWNLHFHWVKRQNRERNRKEKKVDEKDEKDDEKVEKEDEKVEKGDEKKEKEDEDDETKPFKSPAFAGGIFMISRNWFFKLNGFNPLLEIWGGESIEMSIKMWLCGGQIEIVPCSRVGHVFRPRHPFDFPEDDDEGRTTYLRNSKVIAESWLDEYKYFFYASKPSARNLPMPHLGEELSSLKRQLQCRPFAWFLRHVFPELRSPHDDSVAFGQLSSGGRCLRIRRHFDDDDGIFSSSSSSPPSSSSSIYPSSTPSSRPSSPTSARLELHLGSCYDPDVTRWLLDRRSGQLQSSSGACLNVVPAPTASGRQVDEGGDPSAHLSVVLQYCRSSSAAFSSSTSQRWLRRGARLVHAEWRLCLDNPRGDVIAVSSCRRVAPSQLFHFSMEVVVGV